MRMGFESLLVIFLIVEAVWILSSMFRGKKEEEKRRERPQRGVGPATQPPAQRPAPVNAELFLQEINRRRTEAEARQQNAKPSTSATSPGVTRPNVRIEPTRRRERLEERPSPSRRRGPGSVAQESAKPADAVVTVPRAQRPVSFVQVPQEGGGATTRRWSRITETTANTSRERVLAMLHDRDSLQAAILLEQVLGPPLCMRGP